MHLLCSLYSALALHCLQTIRDVTRYVAEKPTELQKFEAAALIQAHVRRFTTMLRMKRQRDAEEAARKVSSLVWREFCAQH